MSELITYIRAAYAQEFEPDEQSPVEDLVRHAFVTLAERSRAISAEKARADKAEARMSVIDDANRSPDPCAWERLKDAAVRATSERDQLRAEVEREKARADKAERERDEAISEVTALENAVTAHSAEAASYKAERDEARRDRDAERARYEQATAPDRNEHDREDL